MRACVVAQYYPRPDDPVTGVWAHRQALATRSAGVDLQVLALERPLPSQASVAAAVRGRPSGLVAELSAAASRPRHATLDGIDVSYVRFVSPPRATSYSTWDRWMRPSLERALERALPFDVVHAHYAVPTAAAVNRFCLRAGLPLVVSVHGGDLFSPLLQAPATRMRVADVLRRAAAVACNGAATAERVAALTGSSDNVHVVHLGTDLPEPLPKHPTPTVATLAHVIPRKRHEDVLAALERLPGVQWVVIGDGPELPRLRSEAKRRKLCERVGFLGQLAPERALMELARCHVMALPSVDEAFGVAYIEALACGVPAIGVRGEGGPEEIAALTPAMVLVPPADPPSLAAAIERLLGDSEALAGEARETARLHFGWEACGQATAAVYREAKRA